MTTNLALRMARICSLHSTGQECEHRLARLSAQGLTRLSAGDLRGKSYVQGLSGCWEVHFLATVELGASILDDDCHDRWPSGPTGQARSQKPHQVSARRASSGWQLPSLSHLLSWSLRQCSLIMGVSPLTFAMFRWLEASDRPNLHSEGGEGWHKGMDTASHEVTFGLSPDFTDNGALWFISIFLLLSY